MANPTLRRLPWFCLAWGCIGLGVLGALLPVMPTVPFLVVAAWAAPKGSPRLANWLHQHKHFGPLLHVWHTQRAVPLRARWLAIAAFTGSWMLLWLTGAHPGVLLGTACAFTLAGGFLLTRPVPTP